MPPSNPHAALSDPLLYILLPPSWPVSHSRPPAAPEIGAAEALKQALREVMGICDHVSETFEKAEDRYYTEGGTGH